MEYQYSEAVWGPAWIWMFGLLVFLGGIGLTAWFFRMARDADADDTPPRVLPPDATDRRG